MENAVTWSKLTLRQKFNAGLFIVFSSLASVIVWQQTEMGTMRREFKKDLCDARKKDSVTILKLEAENKYKDDRYTSFLEAKEKKYTELVEQFEFLNKKADEK